MKMPMDRRLRRQKTTLLFFYSEQLSLSCRSTQSRPFYGRELSRVLAINRDERPTRNMLFNPGKIKSFQTPIRTTTFNSFYASTLGGHLPPFLRGQFSRFFHLPFNKEHYQIVILIMTIQSCVGFFIIFDPTQILLQHERLC